MRETERPELSLDGLYGLQGDSVCAPTSLCVCVWVACVRRVVRLLPLVCVCVCSVVPVGSARGIRLTDVTVSPLYAGIQTRRIHLFSPITQCFHALKQSDRSIKDQTVTMNAQQLAVYTFGNNSVVKLLNLSLSFYSLIYNYILKLLI